MRLYDTIQKSAGTDMDNLYRGLIGNFANALKKAQCFELSPPVVAACGEVCASKPSSIVAATSLLRLPYPTIWLEWYSNRGDYMRHNDKLIPERMGCLITTLQSNSSRGYAYWAWYHHSVNLTIAPFGIAFDWDMSHPPVIEQLIGQYNLPKYLLDAFNKRIGDKALAMAVLANTKKWYDKVNSEKELEAFIQLEKRATLVPNHYATKFIAEYDLLNPNKPGMANFTDDVCGELPFIESFIIMMNSKHILDHIPDDFTKLNKARAKQRKSPLREFTTTRLKLTRTSINRARAAGINRETARIHLVRGHFKVRKSGVYWWSSFTRGSGTHIPRESYKAE